MEFYTVNSQKKDTLYIRGEFGKWYEVVAVFTDDEQANKFMKENKGTGVLKSNRNVIVISRLDDMGKVYV